MNSALLLASGSVTRARMLTLAGVSFEALTPGVDEAAVKAALLAQGATVRMVADALAELKAVKVSSRHPGRLVLGSDQILEQADGRPLDKPTDRATARAHLQALSGREHRLLTAAVIALDGRPLWRVIETARLTMRVLSDDFIDHYLDQAGESVLDCVGAYQLEGLGAQLFQSINGDFFTILGLPLLPVLDFLRQRGVLLR